MNTFKRLVGLATSLKLKLLQDIYLSTRIKIALCMVFFVGLIILGYWTLIGYLEGVITTGILEYLTQVVSTGENDPAAFIATNAQVEAALHFMILLLILLGVFCSIIVSRLALAPVSQAFAMQKRFISGIAHELRTPLSILRMNNEIASFETDAKSRMGKLLHDNLQDIDLISEMLNNLLLLDRMTSAENLRFERLSLQEIIEHAQEKLASFAEQKRIRVAVTAHDIPQIYGNKAALEQVFFNVMKNAIAYTNEGGMVEVAYAGQSAYTVEIRVSDTGVGIPEKDIAHIFEPFYRSETTGKLSGTGIGLAIVAQIMKLHQGTVTVHSVVGKGSSFILSFPLEMLPTSRSLQLPSLNIFKKNE